MKKQQDILENFSEKFPLLTKLYELYQQMPEISKTEENTLRKTTENYRQKILKNKCPNKKMNMKMSLTIR